MSQDNTYDSVTVYALTFNSLTNIRIDRYAVPLYGDSLKIKEPKLVEKLFSSLRGIMRSSPKDKLKKLRKSFSDSTIDVRALFIFYKGPAETIIGVSPQQMIFLDNLLFIGDNKKFEKVVLSTSRDLHRFLFFGNNIR